MASSTIKVRASVRNGQANVRILIKHPMEVGGDGAPPHYIKEVIVEHKGVPVFTSYWGPGISTNPYLSFDFEGAAAGDPVKLSWVDNKGESDVLETTL